jgi:hypothetical protein
MSLTHLGDWVSPAWDKTTAQSAALTSQQRAIALGAKQ